MMRVTFAKYVVWPAVRGVAVIVGARIECEFVEQSRIESCFVLDGGLGCGEDVQRLFDQRLIRSVPNAGAAEKERDRADSLMVIGLAARPGLQNGNWSMPHIIIQTRQGAGD